MWALDRQKPEQSGGMLKGYAEFATPANGNGNGHHVDKNGSNKGIGRLFGSLKKIF